MVRKRLLLGVAAALVAVAAPIAWYLISPLFITRAVDEAFPGVQAVPARIAAAPSSIATAVPASMPADEPVAAMASALLTQPPTSAAPSMAPAPDAEPSMTPQAHPAPSMDAVSAAMSSAGPSAEPEASAAAPPPSEPRVLKRGAFHPVAHAGSGTATIYEVPDGTRVLRLENFDVLNGPDLYVYVSAAPDANDEQTVEDAGVVSLGRLKGNVGNQNYALPAELDLGRANSVSIWCQRFRVNFATAPLN